MPRFSADFFRTLSCEMPFECWVTQVGVWKVISQLLHVPPLAAFLKHHTDMAALQLWRTTAALAFQLWGLFIGSGGRLCWAGIRTLWFIYCYFIPFGLYLTSFYIFCIFWPVYSKHLNMCVVLISTVALVFWWSVSFVYCQITSSCWAFLSSILVSNFSHGYFLRKDIWANIHYLMDRF